MDNDFLAALALIAIVLGTALFCYCFWRFVLMLPVIWREWNKPTNHARAKVIGKGHSEPFTVLNGYDPENRIYIPSAHIVTFEIEGETQSAYGDFEIKDYDLLNVGDEVECGYRYSHRTGLPKVVDYTLIQSKAPCFL